MAEADFARSAGGAAIGARLRRLSERIDGDVAKVYATLDAPFEQRWFGVVNQLSLHGAMSVGELAAALRITHVSVSQTRQSLEKAGLVAAGVDPADARRKPLRLTPQGEALVARLRPLWRAMDEASLELNAAAGDAVAALDRLDDALDHASLFARIQARLGED